MSSVAFSISKTLVVSDTSRSPLDYLQRVQDRLPSTITSIYYELARSSSKHSKLNVSKETSKLSLSPQPWLTTARNNRKYQTPTSFKQTDRQVPTQSVSGVGFELNASSTYIEPSVSAGLPLTASSANAHIMHRQVYQLCSFGLRAAPRKIGISHEDLPLRAGSAREGGV